MPSKVHGDKHAQRSTPSPARPDFDHKMVLLLAGGHFVIDSYTGYLAPLLPILMAEMKISLAAAGVLATILSASTSLPQPIYGVLNDSFGKRFFVYLGPLVTAVFMCHIGFASSFTLLVALLALCGTGSASFHPAAAAMVGRLGGSRRGLAMSIFVTAGNFGHSIGPLVVVPVATSLGLRGLPLLIVAAAAASFLLYRHVPEVAAGRETRVKVDWRRLPWPRFRQLGLLQFVAVVRSSVVTGYATFLPVYMHQQGLSLFSAGATATLFLGIGSLGGLAGGHLSDYFTRQRVMRISMAATVPLLLGFFYFAGAFRFVCLAAGGLALYSSLPLNVVMAQELFPRQTGTVAALMIGFAWGLGGLLLAPLGVAAEHFGLKPTLIGLALLTLLAAIAVFLISDEAETADASISARAA